MKDPNDSTTRELSAVAVPVPQGQGLPLAEGKLKRLPQQSMHLPPSGAKSVLPGYPVGFGRSVIPVSSVARDWGVSARRVRVMLTEGRLAGRQLENGYWEVYFPYQYILGTRGPQIKRQRNLPPKPLKPERMPEW